MNTKSFSKVTGLVMCALFSVVSLAGCLTQGLKSQINPVPQAEHVSAEKEIENQISDIDTEIAKQQKEIADHRSYINQYYLDLWKVEKSGPSSSRGGITNDAITDVEHEIIRIQADIAATEKDITNRKRQIETLVMKKAQLLDQKAMACFPGETLVLMEEGILRPIRLVKRGDSIMTYDIGKQADTPKAVLETYRSENNHYYLINHVVKATAFERFLTPTGWKEILQLKEGDKIFTSQGLDTIRSLHVEKESLEVYNLQVEDSHTFYVVGEGERLYLVHNTGGGGGGK